MNPERKENKMKKNFSILSFMALSFVMSIPFFAEPIGASSGNPPTGVTINWMPIANCGGALAVAIIVFVVMNVMKKKKK